MKNNELARYKSYAVALDHLTENASILKHAPALQALVEAAKSSFNTITEIETAVGKNKTGIAQDKLALQQSMATHAHAISSMISAYALKNTNATLKEEVKYSKSKLKYAADQSLQVYCGNILARASELAEGLKEYGLTEAMLGNFSNQYKQYMASVNDPRIATAEKKEAVARVSVMLRDLGKTFSDQIDPLMRQFEITYPEFYGQYRIKRFIVKAGQRKTRTAGLITGTDPAQLLSDVAVSIKGTGVTVTSDGNGNYDINTPPFKTITLVFEKKGYKTVEREVKPKRGVVGQLDVQLEAA